MKRLGFLLVLLLVLSIISCSNNGDGVLAPDIEDQAQDDQYQSITPKISGSDVNLTEGDDDGDPWEDKPSGGDGDHGPAAVPPVHEPPDPGPDTLPDPVVEP